MDFLTRALAISRLLVELLERRRTTLDGRYYRSTFKHFVSLSPHYS